MPLQSSSANGNQPVAARPRFDRPIRYPQDLPIVAHKEAIIRLLQREQVVVIAGETGSGKTTQIPKMCLEAGIVRRGRIACTQPRRVAALSVSRRIAEELEVEWGKEVGVKIRFTDKTHPDTRIKVMTDGMLLTEIQGDRELRAYDVILLDEAHERSLNIDFLLGYLKLLLQRRRDLKLVITSATIDTTAFAAAFGNAPVLEVSGRLYPVETVYAPIDEVLEDSGETSYVEAVVRAVEEILNWNRPGDILVFLPSEKDIRETRDLLDARGLRRLAILPLFGRLSAAEQENIFRPTQLRKVILATNIAETSITIPGIRFVIDSGLARISRYSPHTHTRRLPIEKIAQSSAEQRKGRAGRLSDGVCIRLYSEADFLARPRYPTPEILRCNLADVILRMLALRIGDIRDFPFLEPPNERAVRSGYAMLAELGALSETEELTPLGQQLARLPVDPTVGRMLLEANKEGCVREVLVIAAGLSIQDPRERPLEQAQSADATHRKFNHPESDFLTLLNIWNAYHDEVERLSQSQLRKFCKAHFLSYLRMREWRDIHTQLIRSLKEMQMLRENSLAAEYDPIHRALLSGLLSGVARHQEGNEYVATRNRKVAVFPGSGLHVKLPRGKRGKPQAAAKGAQKPALAKWVLCAEFMETSRLYARTVARIDPLWILRVGDAVLTRKYTEPYYDEKSERVLVRERQILYGLEISVRPKSFLPVDPVAATEIFIREALVGGRLQTRLLFHESNLSLLETIKEQQTRMRLQGGWGLDERLFQFYSSRLRRIASVGDLKAWLRDQHAGDATVLIATEADLLGGDDPSTDPDAFPDSACFNGIEIPLQYAYKPGDAADGATLRIPVDQFEHLPVERLDWVVPGFIRQRLECLLRGLPKALRKQLFPLNDTIAELALVVRPDQGPLLSQVIRHLQQTRSLRLRAEDFAATEMPEHLLPRLELVDRNARTIASGRDWQRVRTQYEAAIRSSFAKGEGHEGLRVWQDGCRHYEIEALTIDNLPQLPAELVLGDLAGLPVKAYPGLCSEASSVALRLFKTADAALVASAAAIPVLCEQSLGREISWFERDLQKELNRVALAYVDLMPAKQLAEQSYALLRRYLFSVAGVMPSAAAEHPGRVGDCVPAGGFCLSAESIHMVLERGKQRMRGLVQNYVDRMAEIAGKREALRLLTGADAAWLAELGGLLHPRFLQALDWEPLTRYPRYLDALRIRIERARIHPLRDAHKAQAILPFFERYKQLSKAATGAGACAPAGLLQPPVSVRIRWLLEELKVQVFAPELGTAGKVSPKLVSAALDDWARQLAPPENCAP